MSLKCKIAILGCGSSMGVPLIGCECRICNSNNEKNKRTRSSIVIQIEEERILIDASTDIRQQMIKNNFKSFDYALFTHAHADHILGIDDLRSIYLYSTKPVNIFSNQETIHHIEKVFNYMILSEGQNIEFPRFLKTNIINYYELFKIKKIPIMPYRQIHGKKESIGYKIGNFAYSTDLNELPEQSIDLLKNKVDLMIIDCQEYEKKHKSHANLDTCKSLVEKIKPKTTIITHMSHSICYEELSKELNEINSDERKIILSYDGMIIDFDIEFN